MSEPYQGRKLELSRPIFIVTAARSGSTLLRYLLDAHSDIVVPHETNIAEVAGSVVRVWTSELDEQTLDSRKKEATQEVRRLVKRYAQYYCQGHNKSIYCDKSLSTSDFFEAIVEAFPRARFITLYRHSMDMIASGIEASRWGFVGYGFGPFASSNNFVQGMAHYWCHVCERMLELEQQHPKACIRILYEDLVSHTEPAMRDICSFLEVEFEEGMIERGLSQRHVIGPGDYKINFTDHPVMDSIGRGISVPARNMSSEIRTRMNGVLGRLGYPEVGEDWNEQPSVLRAVSRSVSVAPQSIFDIEAVLAGSLAQVDEVLVDRIGVRIEDDALEGVLVVDVKNRVLSRESSAPDSIVTFIAESDIYQRIAAGEESIAMFHLRNEIRASGPSLERFPALQQLHQLLCSLAPHSGRGELVGDVAG